MSSISKKALVTGSLVVLLLVSVYLNYRYNNEPDKDASGWPTAIGDEIGATASPLPSTDPEGSAVGSPDVGETVGSADFFASFKTERDETRDQELAQLEAIIADTKSGDENIQQAQQRKLEMLKLIDQTMVVENLIEAKGFANVAAAITTKGVTIVVDETLTQAQASQIMDIVRRETDFGTENIKIMPNK